jgi:hypothetical protein
MRNAEGNVLFPIILVGDKKEIALGEQLTAALSKSSNVLHITGCRIFNKFGKQSDFVIAEVDDNCSFSIDCGVVILKESAKNISVSAQVPIISPSNTNSENISCGTSKSDTFSLSSYFDKCASVSLQKPLLCGSRYIEPREIPLRLSAQYDKYVLMCAVAVLLLSGRDIDSLNF